MSDQYKTAVILGSGLGQITERMTLDKTCSFAEVLGSSITSVAGHSGQLYFGSMHGHKVICCQGRPHWYEGRESQDFLDFIQFFKDQGVENLIITNASGGLSPKLNPGDVVLINDHINFQLQTPLIGKRDADSKHFLSQDAVYDETMRSRIQSSAKKLDIHLPTGVYMSVLGPCFETPAEVNAFRMLGADVIGMSSVPEVIVAKYLGLKVAMVSVIVNMGAGMSNALLSHAHTLEMAKQSDTKLADLLEGYFKAL
ncbi:MAG: purine-nucleoside phosphorylase [Legionellales bacterium]|nr:purine-nucleoside phosphorylase [Legionellales bacterium]OUX64871.1 MAG: purine-nucleoside phosphorylase [Gammaproteobacteria bacterium TMED281]